jgi:hypothetical protein
MIVRFDELPIGARFEFWGRRYEKVATGMGQDEERRGNCIHGHAEVRWDQRPGEELVGMWLRGRRAVA